MKISLFLLILISFAQIIGQEHSGAYTFIENKGQWPDQVNFKSDLRSGYLYLENDALLFDLYDPQTVNKYIEGHYKKELRKEITSLDWHAYKMTFENCNSNVSIQKEHKTEAYYNYFLGNNPENWGSKAYGYDQITYSNIYTGIDFKMYSQLFNLKYDFIVAPNANPDLIQLKYEGPNKIELRKGRLHIFTSVNHIIEAAPIVYQIIDGKRKLIAAKYILNENVISYQIIDKYDHSKPLIIDPTLVFSTYSGSFSNNFGYSATFDSKGFLYSGSSAFGNNYPTVLGSYNTSFSGGIVDIAISKFDTTGTFLIYSTYIGGNSDELPHSLIVNSLDELFIFGTSSSPNYPTTVGAYDNSFNGGTPNNLQNGLGVNYVNGSDIVVSRLSADGTTLQASTYVGGSANDGLNSTNVNATLNKLRYNYADEVRGEIEIDANNNIYVATCTRSLDFPTTAGSFQPNYGGGAIDGCVFKLDNNLQNMIWSSYIGGEKHDAVYALAIDDSNDIYLTGGTESDSLFTTFTALDTVFQGGRSDGFVTHIKGDGSTILHSTYIGSNTYDQSYFVDLDRAGDVYLLGQTEIQDSTFVKNVTWSNFGSGQFVAKLSPELDTLLYSTVFGSGNGINISPTAFLVDLCSKIYLAGWGGAVNNLSSLFNNVGNTNGMPLAGGPYQSTTDGSDFYVMVIEDDASGVVYGSYFGGGTSAEHVDGGTSRFDRKGKVYQAMCAGCGGNSDMPINPTNALSPTNNNSCNLGVFKMDFELPVVVADFDVPPLGCAPYIANFINTSLSQANTNFSWDFGDGGTSTIENPTHTYTNSGTYTISLIIEDPATCNFGDTIQKDIIIIGDTTYSISSVNICPGEIEQIGLLPQNDPSITYSWSPNTALSNDTISNPFANPSVTTSYQLLISNGVCTDTILQNVIVNTPLLNVSPDTTLCDTTISVTLNANASGTSSTYLWSSNNNFSDTLITPINQANYTVSPNVNTTYYVQISNNGCSLYDSVNVNISLATINPSSGALVCEGDTVSIVANNFPATETLTYNWAPSGTIIQGNGTDSITVNPNATQYYYLTATTSIGCILEDSVLVNIQNHNPNQTLGTVTICPNESTPIGIAPTPLTNYLWNPTTDLTDATISNPVATPLFTTNYELQINDGICVDTVLQTVIVSAVSFVVSNDTTICDTTQIVILNGDPLGTSTNVYWSSNNNFTDTLNNPTTNFNLSVGPDINTTYYVNTMSNGCLVTDSATIFLSNSSLSLSAPQTICNGDSILMIATNLNINDIFVYDWSADSTILSGDGTDSIWALPLDDEIYYLNAVNNIGCTFFDSITISVQSPAPILTLADVTICPDDSSQIGITNNPNFTYLWTPNTNLSYDTLSNPIASPSSNSSYELWINNGVCTDTVLQNVLVSTISFTVSNDTTICDDSQVVTLVSNSSGTSSNFYWSSNASFTDTINTPTTQPNITVSPSTTTTYYVNTYSNGCYMSDSATIFLANFALILSPDSLICEGDSIQLFAINQNPNDTFTYDWSADSTILQGDGTSSIWVMPMDNEYYYLNAVNSIGCTIFDSILVTVDNLPSISIQASANPDTIYTGNSTTLNVVPNGYTYSWSPYNLLSNPDLQNPSVLLWETTTFEVTVSNPNSGCQKTGEVTVYVKEIVCGEPDIFVPTAFTPNNDNTNDVLYVRGNNLTEILFRVYNRWGELVFETTDQNIGWDGLYKGKEADPAVFDWYVEGTCIDNETFFIKGNVSLLR